MFVASQERGPESRWQERMTLTLGGGGGVEWTPLGPGAVAAGASGAGAASSPSFALSIASSAPMG